MATKTFCDGCTGECGDADLTSVGRYDPCVYCPDCLATWRAHEAAERQDHAKVVALFEGLRARRLADLKAGGLARLPDEG